MRALRVKLAVGVAVLGAAGVGTVAVAGDRGGFHTELSGYEEVPAVSTEGGGEFRARVSRETEVIDWELTYEGPFNGEITQSHIHFAQKSVNGAIAVFLCSNLGNGPAGTQACPPEGTITGTIVPENVGDAAAGQGLAAGEFAELVRAMRAGATYVNVHSRSQPGGEVRGQLGGRHRDWDEDEGS
jgi:CHRD domain